MDKGKGQVLPYLTFREQKTNLIDSCSNYTTPL